MNKYKYQGLSGWIDYCRYQHDVNCNQKYHKYLPYSFHLEMVAATVNQVLYLYPKYKELSNFEYVLAAGAWGHDLIEDARVTYNDIAADCREIFNNVKAADEIAEIIFLCSEVRGRNRTERHGGDFYPELFQNKQAVFTKLCDILANIRFSKLSNSSMYKKYKTERLHMKNVAPENIKLEFAPIFDLIDDEFNLI